MSAESLLFDLSDKAQRYLSVGIVSAIGGIASYLYEHAKGDRDFSFITFLIMIFLAFFVGNVMGEFIPHDMKSRDGILMVAGFSSWPILDALKSNGKKIADAFLARLTRFFK